MRSWVVCLALALAACGDSKATTDGGSGSGDGGGSGDAGGTPVTCMAPSVHDAFDAGPPCSGWGTVQMTNSVVAVIGGKLTVTPGSTGSSLGGCSTTLPQPLTDFGFFVSVAAAGTAMGELTKLQITDPGTSNATWSITYAGGMLTFANINETVAMRAAPAGPLWWRLHPDAAHTMMLAETSPDGHVWTVLGATPSAIPSMVTVMFGAGSFNPTMPPTAASFDSFDVCP